MLLLQGFLLGLFLRLNQKMVLEVLLLEYLGRVEVPCAPRRWGFACLSYVSVLHSEILLQFENNCQVQVPFVAIWTVDLQDVSNAFWLLVQLYVDHKSILYTRYSLHLSAKDSSVLVFVLKDILSGVVETKQYSYPHTYP